MARAQQDGGTRRLFSEKLSAEVCRAIEHFIAQIDSARGFRDKAVREEKYASAQKSLAEVLKRHDNLALLSVASEYARYTELVASGDPKDAKLDELLENRLKSRTALLELCTDYVSRR
jgi:hypothetical protein